VDRGRVLIVGATEEHALAATLRGAGYTVAASPRVPHDVDAQVIAVAGADLVGGCRSARAASATAQVLALLAQEDDPVAGTCLAAGADDLIGPTASRTAVLARVRSGVIQATLRAQAAATLAGYGLCDEIAGLLTGDDPDEALFETCVRLADAVRFTRCAVITVPADEPSTGYVNAASDDTALTRFPLDLRKYPELTLAMERRTLLFVPDVGASVILGERAAQAARHGGRSALVVPLLSERRPLGVLFLRSTGGRDDVSPEERLLLTTVASLIVNALRSGRFEAIRELTRRTLLDHEQQRRLRALDQYRDFFESAADGMLVLDGRGEVLYLNRVAEQITGYARSGLTGRVIHEIVDPAQHAGLTELLEQAALGQPLGAFDLHLRTTSGEPLRVSASTSSAMSEHGVVVLSFRDVTVARALEEELRKTKEFLERLIDSTVDAIVACDVHGKIIIFNQGAERLCGYTADEVIGKLPVWRLYPEGEAKTIMAQLRSPEHGVVGRLGPTRREIVSHDGVRVPVLLSASIIYENGREVASVGIFSDLRERINIEQRLAQAQEKLLVSEKQALIADLAGTAAHELNQPLTSVIGYAELLKKRLAEGDPNVRAADIIIREAERMAAIVRKIGKITRYETKAYVGSTTILDLDKSATEG
jgi:PAS domain S-box-containing protein